MSKILLTIVIISIILLSSCGSSIKIDLLGKPGTVKKWKKFGLLEVILTPPEVPTYPLIDAGIYKSSFNSIYGDVIILHEKHADSIVKHLGQLFAKYSKSNVLYGEKLFSLLPPDVLTANNIKTYKPFLKNENFPKISLPKYALNFYDFSEISSTYGCFSKKFLDSNKTNIKNLCKMLDVDGLLVSTISVHTVDVGILGLYGELRLDAFLFFLDKEGNSICKGTILSKPESGSPDDFNNYELVFGYYYDLSNKLLRKLYLDEEPSDE